MDEFGYLARILFASVYKTNGSGLSPNSRFTLEFCTFFAPVVVVSYMMHCIRVLGVSGVCHVCGVRELNVCNIATQLRERILFTLHPAPFPTPGPAFDYYYNVTPHILVA